MNVSAQRHILSRSEWFAGLPAPLAEAIFKEARLLRLKDAPVYLTGDPPNGLFAVLSGEVHVAQNSGDGRIAHLHSVGPGGWFGESSMLDGEPRFSDADAIGDTRLLRIGRDAFQRLTKENPAFYPAFTRLLCAHYRVAISHIVSSATLPVMTRLAQRLLHFARLEGRSRPGSRAIEFRLSQENLASTVGVSRQTLNGLLKTLEADGLIEIGYARVTLKRPAAIEKLAREERPVLSLGGV